MWPVGKMLAFRRSISTTTAAVAASKKWDAIVIGGGHNGLTAAAYLARSGLSVAVLERRHLVGGAAVTEEIVPGFRFSRCSYLQSLLRPAIIQELELKRHGLKLLRRSPSSFTPCLDGRYLLLGPDAELNHSEIAKFSKKDALAYPRYEEQLQKFCKFMDSLLDSPTPEVRKDMSSFVSNVKDKLQRSAFWSRFLQHALTLGQKDLLEFVELLVSPASKVLNNWFEGEVLKTTLATDAVIGSMVHLRPMIKHPPPGGDQTHGSPKSGTICLYIDMRLDLKAGVWSEIMEPKCVRKVVHLDRNCIQYLVDHNFSCLY